MWTSYRRVALSACPQPSPHPHMPHPRSQPAFMLLVGWLLNASWVMRAGCTAGVPQVIGGVLGYVHKVSGEFVGTPSVQWFRQSTRSGEARFVAIAEATDLSYMPTADDVGARLRVECTGPYGGTTVHVDTAPLALDRTSHAELETILRRGQAEFHASTPQQESRKRVGKVTARELVARRPRGDQHAAGAKAWLGALR